VNVRVDPVTVPASPSLIGLMSYEPMFVPLRDVVAAVFLHGHGLAVDRQDEVG
jgi:hypothetical protein